MLRALADYISHEKEQKESCYLKQGEVIKGHEFLDKYKDTIYADGTCAKLAVYCGQIPTLEEENLSSRIRDCNGIWIEPCRGDSEAP